MSDRTGQVIGGRFRIDGPLGKGAMATVFRAVDLTTNAYVAVKVLRSALNDPSAEHRFKREGEVQERIRHRNIAALLDSGITDHAEPYLVVEMLRGKTLRGVLKDEGGRVSARRAASYAWQALQGLSAVHAAGVLHRDLKPANIMLEPSPGPVERVVLIDFGFATFEGSARLTALNTVVGSLRYMAPERLRGEQLDPRSDLYAIGVILYEMLTGQPVFAAKDDFGLIDAHLNHEPPALDESFPHELDEIIVRSLAKQQDERYASATEMAKALETASMRLTG